jgi:hypothetical protein
MNNKANKTDRERALRDHLSYLLRGGGAHIDFDTFVADFPVELIDRKPGHLPYTPWQVLEHMRIAQWDILEFCRNAGHVSPEFPKGYWPPATTVPTLETWRKTIQAFRSDLKKLEKLLGEPATDLFSLIPHGEGQTILREALLVADHNSYHLGALLVMKRILTQEEV